jgi:hypothetical protein
MKQRLLAGVVLCFLFVPAWGQTPSGVEQRLRADLKFLTSAECEGRGINTKGIELAADYIQRQFINAGLKPGGKKGSYYQPFNVIASAKLGAGSRLILKGPLGQTIALEHGKHFRAWALGGSGKVEAPLVFAGYGLTSADPPYDDFAGLNVKGKVVVVLADAPRRAHPFADVFVARAPSPMALLSLQNKVENAKKHQAAAVLIVNSRQGARLQDRLPPLPVTAMDIEPFHVPVAYVKRDLIDAMLSPTDLAQIEKRIDADLKPRSTPLTGWTCRLETEATFKYVPVKNVIGVMEGSGPLSKETVVIGAHYDHVGYAGSTRPLGAKALGVSGPGSIGGVGFPLARVMDRAIHPGADDNASGTSVLLELARRFGQHNDWKGRRLVFIAFTAEESGLVGSTYYCRHPAFPLEETTTMVNMDQVGRLQDDMLLVGGVGSAMTFAGLIDRLNDKHHFQLSRETSGTAPTDNASFNARKIPVLWFFTGFHEHYHRPSDTVETLNVPGLAKIVNLVTDVIGEVATTSSRPEYIRTGPFDRTKTLWSSAPSTGMVANYADGNGGVLLKEVIQGTAAARAGLKKGDRLLAIAGKQLSPTEFLTFTRTLKAGQDIDLVIERAGKSEAIKLQLARGPAGVTEPRLGFTADPADSKGGVLVTGVVTNGPAAKAGLKKGDRIVRIDDVAIVDRTAYLEVTRTLQSGASVRMTVERNGQRQQLLMAVGEQRKRK